MSIGSIKRKINAKTLLGQSSALRENSEVLKKGVAKLASVLVEKRKIKPSTLMATKEKKPQVEVVKEEEGKKEEKKSGKAQGAASYCARDITTGSLEVQNEGCVILSIHTCRK